MNVNRETTSREVALKAGFVHCDLKTLLLLRAFRIQRQNYTYSWTFNHLRLNPPPFVLFVSPSSAYVVIEYRRVQRVFASAYFITDDESTIKLNLIIIKIFISWILVYALKLSSLLLLFLNLIKINCSSLFYFALSFAPLLILSVCCTFALVLPSGCYIHISGQVRMFSET
jgi:hypothetical protein